MYPIAPSFACHWACDVISLIPNFRLKIQFHCFFRILWYTLWQVCELYHISWSSEAINLNQEIEFMLYLFFLYMFGLMHFTWVWPENIPGKWMIVPCGGRHRASSRNRKIRGMIWSLHTHHWRIFHIWKLLNGKTLAQFNRKNTTLTPIQTPFQLFCSPEFCPK